MKIALLPFAAACLLAGASLGCSPGFDHLDMVVKTHAPEPITMSYTSVMIPEGIAVGISPIAMAGDSKLDGDKVELHSSDPTIVGVDPTLEQGSFVVYGVNHGTAHILVVVAGESKSAIPVTVTPQ